MLSSRSSTAALAGQDRQYPLRGAKSVVDLCAAPGSWCQVLKQRCGASCKVVAVDVQAMQPLDGVTILQGDITAPDTLSSIQKACSGKADVIICDGAPEVSGLHDVDEHAHDALAVLEELVDVGAQVVEQVLLLRLQRAAASMNLH